MLSLILSAAAVPLYPQITFDSREGAGQNLFTTQGLEYQAGVRWAGSARALAITFHGTTSMPLVNGTFDAHAAFVGASAANGIVTGNFLPENDGLPSFVLADATGVLLSGPYYSRQIIGLIGSDEGTSFFTFQAISGSLLPFFLAASDGVGLINFDLFNVSPPFSQNSFATNFNSHFAGVIAPVPEPSTLMLFGFGSMFTAGLVWIKKKRHS